MKDRTDCAFGECVNVPAANKHGLCYGHAKQLQRRGSLELLEPLRSSRRIPTSRLADPEKKVPYVDWASLLIDGMPKARRYALPDPQRRRSA